jgi:hypothetical protein
MSSEDAIGFAAHGIAAGAAVWLYVRARLAGAGLVPALLAATVAVVALSLLAIAVGAVRHGPDWNLEGLLIALIAGTSAQVVLVAVARVLDRPHS